MYPAVVIRYKTNQTETLAKKVNKIKYEYDGEEDKDRTNEVY